LFLIKKIVKMQKIIIIIYYSDYFFCRILWQKSQNPGVVLQKPGLFCKIQEYYLWGGSNGGNTVSQVTTHRSCVYGSKCQRLVRCERNLGKSKVGEGIKMKCFNCSVHCLNLFSGEQFLRNFIN